MSQLQLLNTTVSSIAISVNTILTASYHACYEYENEHGDQDEMMLVTAPLSSTTEIEALYNSKLIDFESALHEGVGVCKVGEGVCVVRVGRRVERVVLACEIGGSPGDKEV